MIQNSRKLLPFRKRIIRLLTERFGYKYEDKRKRTHTYADARLTGPHVDGPWLLSDMERINLGEAHFHAEHPCSEMEALGYSNRTRDEKIEQYFELMFCGWEFQMRKANSGPLLGDGEDEQYGTVQFVDWLYPENNSYTVYEGWPGVLGDGVAWDLIIALNHIPVAAVMLAPTTPGHRPCEEAYQQMRRQLDADPVLSTYLTFCIIGDGNQMLVGGPDDLAEWFMPWEVPASVFRDAFNGYQLNDSRMLPIYALLRPEALCDYINGFVRPTGSDRGIVRFCAQCHQFYAVQALLYHLRNGYGTGYAILPDADDLARPTPTGSSKETVLMLVAENYSIRYFDPEEAADSEVGFMVFLASEYDARLHTGQSVYYPIIPLVSPLA